jgi:hypothetical protein
VNFEDPSAEDWDGLPTCIRRGSKSAIACVDDSYVVIDAVSGEIYGRLGSLDMVAD